MTLRAGFTSAPACGGCRPALAFALLGVRPRALSSQASVPTNQATPPTLCVLREKFVMNLFYVSECLFCLNAHVCATLGPGGSQKKTLDSLEQE